METCVRREEIEEDPLKELRTFKFALTGEDLTYASCKKAEEGQPEIYLNQATRKCIQVCSDTEGNVLSLDGLHCLSEATGNPCGEHEVLENVQGKTYLKQCVCKSGFTLADDE